MIKTAAKALLLLAWTASMFWLVRYEAFPDRFAAELTGYRTLARDRAEVSDTWMKILFNGAPIGYSHGTVQLNEEAKELELVMENTTTVQVKLLGVTQRLKLTTKVMLNASYELNSFEMGAFGMGQSMLATGSRIAGERYALELELAGTTRKSEITIPGDTVLFTPYLEMAMKRMKPGEELVMNGMDPLTMTRNKIRLRAEARETLPVMGRDLLCTRIAVTAEGIVLKTWIDPDGRVVRQTTPFGWILEACDGNEAIALMGDKNNAAPSLPLPAFFGPSLPAVNP